MAHDQRRLLALPTLIARMQVSTPAGRTLGFELFGPEDGDPIVAIHGTPGSRVTRFPIGDPYTAAGVRVLRFDRGGYGLSTRAPGRSVGDCVSDVLALVDHVGWDRFAVTGSSGGGPHALACGALLAGRVTRVMVERSLAPFDAEGLDWYEGMTDGNVNEFGAAEQGEEALRAVVETEAAAILEHVAEESIDLLGDSYAVAEADKAAMSDEAVARELRTTLREALRHGVDGWVDDDLAFVKPWGFDPRRMTVPVVVRYGAADTLVPAAHGRWLATRIDGAIEERDVVGHIGSIDPDEVTRQYRWLATG
jgi:pimeloyl-ACP methyl ester carboxylesterase